MGLAINYFNTAVRLSIFISLFCFSWLAVAENQACVIEVKDYWELPPIDFGKFQFGEDQVQIYCRSERLSGFFTSPTVSYLVRKGEICKENEIPANESNFSGECRLKIEKSNDLLKVTDKVERNSKTKKFCTYFYEWNSQEKKLQETENNCLPLKLTKVQPILDRLLGDFRPLLRKLDLHAAENFLTKNRKDILLVADVYSPYVLFGEFEKRLLLFQAYDKWSKGQLETAKKILLSISQREKDFLISLCPGVYRIKKGEVNSVENKPWETGRCYGSRPISQEKDMYFDFPDPSFSLFVMDSFLSADNVSEFFWSYRHFVKLDSEFVVKHQLKYLRKYRNEELKIYLKNDPKKEKYKHLLAKDLEEASLGDLRYRMQYYFGDIYEDYFKVQMRAGRCDKLEPEIFEMLIPHRQDEEHDLKSSDRRQLTYWYPRWKPCPAEYPPLLSAIKSAFKKDCKTAAEAFQKYQKVHEECPQGTCSIEMGCWGAH